MALFLLKYFAGVILVFVAGWLLSKLMKLDKFFDCKKTKENNQA